MSWTDIGKKIASVGLPILGGALGGPAGAVIAKGVAGVLGLDVNTPDELSAALQDISPEQLLALKKYEAENAKELAGMAMNYDVAQLAGQIDLAKIDQQSGSKFRAGWRPAVGWICTAGLAYTFILRPLLPWVVKVGSMMFDTTAVIPLLPAIDTGDLLVLLGGMLGLGGARTFEKIRGLK